MKTTIAFITLFLALAFNAYVNRHNVFNYPRYAPHATYRVQKPTTPTGPGEDMNLQENKALKDQIAEDTKVLPLKTTRVWLATGYSKRPVPIAPEAF